MTDSIEYHEYANLFPMMDAQAFAELKQDILENGLIEPVVLYDEKILDGRNRYKACTELGIDPRFERVNGGTNPLHYVISKNLKRRHLNESQRAVVAARLANMSVGRNWNNSANLQNKKTQPEAASMLNVSPRTVATVKAVEKAAPELIEKIERGEMTAHEAEKKVKEMRRFEQHAALVALANKHEAKEYAGFGVNDVYVADVHKLELSPNSVDMIFTDPPYHDEHLELFMALARLAHRVLKPGAYLMTYSGKMFLPQVMNALGECLEYVWTYGVFQPDSNHKIQKHHIFQAWRPIVCFKKPGKTANVDWQPDMIKATRDKTYHEWQQQIEPPLKWIEAYTLPGDLVIDPFVGGGTTLVACKELKRNYMGFDIDPEAVKLSKLRLEGK